MSKLDNAFNHREARFRRTMTKSEKLIRSDELAETFEEIAKEEAALKELTKEAKDRIKDIERRQKEAAADIKSGTFVTLVSVAEVISGDMVEIFDANTGESLSSRPVEPEDRQVRPLFPLERPAFNGED